MTDRLQTVKKLFMIPFEKFSVSNQSGVAEPMETNELKKPYYLLREEMSDFWIHVRITFKCFRVKLFNLRNRKFIQ